MIEMPEKHCGNCLWFKPNRDPKQLAYGECVAPPPTDQRGRFWTGRLRVIASIHCIVRDATGKPLFRPQAGSKLITVGGPGLEPGTNSV